MLWHKWTSQEALGAKNLPANTRYVKHGRLIRGSGRSPGEGNKWLPAVVFLPGESRTEEPVGLQFMRSQKVRHV